MAKPRKGGGELYYVDENGERQDAELHLLPSLTKLTFPVSTQHPDPDQRPFVAALGIKQ